MNQHLIPFGIIIGIGLLALFDNHFYFKLRWIDRNWKSLLPGGGIVVYFILKYKKKKGLK